MSRNHMFLEARESNIIDTRMSEEINAAKWQDPSSTQASARGEKLKFPGAPSRI